MKRYVLLSVAALAFLSCQDANKPVGTAPAAPLFAIYDGANGCEAGDPCEHFYLLPPIVRNPRYSGKFNPYLRPSIQIFATPELSQASLPDLSCEFLAMDREPIASFDNLTADPDGELYAASWQTGVDNNVSDDTVHRGCWFLAETVTGFRDFLPQSNKDDLPRHPERAPEYAFENGSTVPLKARYEFGVLCDEDAGDCGEGVLTADGGLVVTERAYAGIQATTTSGDVTIIVQEVACPTDPNGKVKHADLDLSQYGPCYDIDTYPSGQQATLSDAVSGVCLDISSGYPLKPEQDDLLQLHHKRSDGSWEALATAAAPFLACEGAVGAASSNPVVRFAKAGARVLVPFLFPSPLHARHLGLGGRGQTSESPLVWALPAQMEIVEETNNQAAPVGEAVLNAPAVRVLDAGFPQHVPPIPQQPVEGVTVRFSVISPYGSDVVPDYLEDGIKVTTDEFGIARVDSWTMGLPNPNLLEAAGYGIGAIGLTGVFSEHGQPDEDVVIILPDGASITGGSAPLVFTGTGVVTLLPQFLTWEHGTLYDGQLIAPAVQVLVTAEDGSTPIPGVSVTLQAYNNNGTPAELSGGESILTGPDGVATFDNLILNSPGAYRWEATAYLEGADPETVVIESGKFHIKPFKN